MNQPQTTYCTNCARPGDRTMRFCQNCGSPRQISRERRAGHVAFVLNELEAASFTIVTTPEQRARLSAAYEAQLRELTAPAPRRAPVVAPAPQQQHSGVEAADRRATPPPPAPRRTREPFDWSWLAEQQANLFLFAGAFLTVVAALIYVGYSGAAVSGALKMSLLAGYTLAFLAGGVACMRYSRVATAGQVFFAVGAMLVPLNFVAAHSILADRELSRESLWLAGSIVSVAFYAAVAYTGLGRMYALGAAAAAISGGMAAAVISDLPVEWAPLAFIGLAFAMLLTDLAGTKTLHQRIGETWSPIAQSLAVLAASSAVLIAMITADADDELVVSTRWFLPVTLVAFTAAAAVPTLATRRQHFGLATLVGVGATIVSGVYALDLAPEAYVLAFAAVAAVYGAIVYALDDARVSKRLPAGSATALYNAAVLSTLIAAVGALIALVATNDSEGSAGYGMDYRWSLAVAAAACAAFYGAMALRLKQAFDVAGLAAAIAGLAFAMVYTTNAPWEAYALTSTGLALVFGAGVVALRVERVARRFASSASDIAYVPGAIAAVLGAFVTLQVLVAAEQDAYTIRHDWFAVEALAPCAAFFGAMAFVRSQRFDITATAIGVTMVSAAIVYTTDLSPQYYAAAFIVPSIVGAALVRWAPGAGPALGGLHKAWRDDLMVSARAGAALGASIAVLGAIAATIDGEARPAYTYALLPVALAGAAAVYGIEASRRKSAATTGAFLFVLGGAAVSVPFAFQADAEYYGLALSATALLYAAGGAWTPAWLHRGAREALAAFGAAAATLPFEGAYANAPQIGAITHFGAALLFGAAAVIDDSKRTAGSLLDMPSLSKLRLAMGWLYAAGVAAVIGYLWTLRAVEPDQQTIQGAAAFALLAASLAFIATGAALRRWRAEFSPHMYVMSLALALGSVALAGGAGVLSAVLAVHIAAYVALALYERQPLCAAPAAVFGFALVEALRRYAGADLATIPLAYSGVAIASYAGVVALRRTAASWSGALRMCGAIYGLAAPAVGFALVAAQSEAGMVEGAALETSALYQVSTLAVALVGVIALVESAIAHRRWIIVPASAVLLVALLLQIARLQPDDVQAYAIPVGVYLLLLGVAGLSRLKLIPELEPAAVYVEAIGAATIMLPTFVQSFGGGWYYQVVLVVESAAFFSAGVALRRRGMLSAAITFIVLVAGRALFDAVYAMPNWVVVMIAGMALLGIGMGILAGRERWDRWQRTLLSWWEEAGNGALAP